MKLLWWIIYKPKKKSLTERYFQLNDNILGLLVNLVRFTIFFHGQWLLTSMLRIEYIYLLRTSLVALQTSDQTHLLLMKSFLICFPKGSKFLFLLRLFFSLKRVLKGSDRNFKISFLTWGIRHCLSSLRYFFNGLSFE